MTDQKGLQGLPVAGYRDQTADAVALVNESKLAEECVLRMLDVLSDIPGVDKRWLQIGRTQIEQGFMAVNRAIFKPQRVVVPHDAFETFPRHEENIVAADMPKQQPITRF